MALPALPMNPFAAAQVAPHVAAGKGAQGRVGPGDLAWEGRELAFAEVGRPQRVGGLAHRRGLDVMGAGFKGGFGPGDARVTGSSLGIERAQAQRFERGDHHGGCCCLTHVALVSGESRQEVLQQLSQHRRQASFRDVHLWMCAAAAAAAA